MKTKINFLPFVGKNYNQQKTKILVLGESHYTGGEPGWDSITNDVFERYLNYINGNGKFETWMNTFTKFAKTFANGIMAREQISDFWDGVVFYNFVQEPMSGPRIAPTAQQFKNSEAAFAKILETYKPDLIIVWGNRLWNNISKDLSIPMDFVTHPSASGYRYNEMYDKINRLLAR